MVKKAAQWQCNDNDTCRESSFSGTYHVQTSNVSISL